LSCAAYLNYKAKRACVHVCSCVPLNAQRSQSHMPGSVDLLL